MEHWFVVIALVVMYFLPTIIAFARGHSSKMAIALVNLLFAVTVIGWIIALVWSLSSKGQNITIINQVGK